MRIDLYLARYGYAKSRTSAKQMIESGSVTIDGTHVQKVSDEIDENAAHDIKIDFVEKYVSRGGLKLEAALDKFGIDVTGMTALDIGASTGGFTDCLLKRGAAHVTAVDSGSDQLDKTLLADVRVTNIEKYNARTLSDEIIPGGADIVVMDVSFISQTMIIPALPKVMKPDGFYIGLIKPQFEVGRSRVGKGGIVKSADDRLYAVMRVSDCAASSGLYMTALTVSPITGGDGNVEYLGCFARNAEKISDDEIKMIVRGKK